MRFVFIALYFLFICFLPVNNLQSQTTAFSEQAKMMYDLKKYEELISFCDINLPNAIQKKDSLEISKLYFEKSRGLYHKGRQVESIENLKLAEKHLPKSSDNTRLKADIMYFFHINYGIKSFILKELQYGQKSLELYESEAVNKKDYEQILILYRRLANPNVTLGNYEVATNYLNKADDLLNEIPSTYNLPQPLINYKFSAGYNKIVVDLIETAFFPENYDSTSIKKITQRVVREKEKLDTLYEINKNSSDVNVEFRSYSSALNFYCRYLIVNQDKIDFNLSNLHDEIDKSILLLEDKNRPRYIHLYLGNKVDVYVYEKAYVKALNSINKIIDEAGENHNRYINFLFQKAKVLFAKGDIEGGKEWITKGIEKIHSGTEPLKADYSNFEPGFKLEDVYLLLSVADRIIEKSSMTEADKNSYSSLIYTMAFKQFLNTYTTQPLNKRTQNTFKIIVKNLMLHNRLDKVQISQIENIENRLAWQQFSQSRDVVQLPVIDSLEQIDFQLRKQLVNAKKQRKLKEVDSINDALKKYQEELETAYPKLANFTQDNFEVTEFQNKIAEDEIVLKYLFFNEKFALFQISKDTIEWSLKTWRNDEKKMLEAHLKQLREPSKVLHSNDSLTNLLLPKNISDFKVITIIPDIPIYQLPFETLIYNNEYLVKSKAIRYSSHLRFAYINDDTFKQESKQTIVSIFAPKYPKKDVKYATRSVPYHLKGAQREAEVIGELFTAVSFTGNEATKQHFIDRKSESTILHMAMHATIDKDNPEFSSFNFSNNEKLYLEELYSLKIPGELAVLSACNTGVGKVEGASGMASLQRALTFAGTKATVASLWEVPDKTTSGIMISFYKYLKKGKRKSEALQLAKQDYLKVNTNSKLNHPYYWAGFVLYGEDTPVTAEQSNTTLWYIFGIVCSIALLGFFYFKRKKIHTV